VPKEKIHEGPNGGGNPNDGGDDDGGDPSDVRSFRDAFIVLGGLPSLHHGALRIGRRIFQAMEAMRQRMEDMECVVEDDYKFLNRNVRKLFGMVGNMKSKWCKSCGKFH
jgi:hypothetical protein